MDCLDSRKSFLGENLKPEHPFSLLGHIYLEHMVYVFVGTGGAVNDLLYRHRGHYLSQDWDRVLHH